MALIIIIDLLVIGVLSVKAFSSGLEEALPFATFAIVFLPIETRLSAGIFELTIQRLVVVLLFLLFFLTPRSKKPEDARLAMPLKWLMLAHISWCILSTLFSIDPVASVKKLVSVVFEYYGLYYIFWKSISKPETIRKVMLAMMLAMAIASIFGTYEAYRGWNVVDLLPKVGHRFFFGADVVDADRDIRVQSTFDHPILFGAALAMAIPIVLYFMTIARTFRHKLLLWIALALMFLNLYKTGSRGPWLDAILACILLFFYGGSVVRRRILIIGALCVSVMILRPGIRDTIYGIYVNTLNTNTNTGASYEYRYALPQASIHAISRSPGRAMWGYGLETFFDADVEGMFLGQMYRFRSADNAWAELAVETGFVGLLILAILLLKPMFAGWRQSRKFSPPDKYLAAVLFINLLVFYFQMYSVGMYSWGQNGYMLWILIAATMALPAVRQEEEQLTGAEDIRGSLSPAWKTENAGRALRPKSNRAPATIGQR